MNLESYLRTRADRGAAIREMAQRQSMYGDDPGMIVAREIAILRAPIEVTIQYLDAEERPSTRTIQIRRFDGHYISAHCLMRRAQRTFIARRVGSAFDIDGVEIPDFSAFLEAHYGEDNLLSTARERQKYWRFVEENAAPELLLLRIVAAADGSLAPQEAAVIGDHAISLVSRRELPGERDELLRYASRLSGTAETVGLAMQVVATRTKIRRKRFGEACLAVVEADGHIAEHEIDMLRILEQASLFV